MKILSACSLFAAVASLASAQQAPLPTNALPTNAIAAPATPGTISVQEMLVSGPTQLKLHSLAMITQGNVKGEIDASYLPGFKICAEDPALPLRSVTAQLLGQHFVQGKENPNPEAVALLAKLARDEESYVRYNAVYYGLSQIRVKSDETINLLIDVACRDREQGLLERIAESLQPDREKVVGILDRKLLDGSNVAVFEIYKELTGNEPPHAEKYIALPSSLPFLFIFKGEGTDPDASKADLEKALKEAGMENPTVQVSGSGANHVLLLKTYLTKDRLAVASKFTDAPGFKISQTLWLTPEIEVQINAMRKQ